MCLIMCLPFSSIHKVVSQSTNPHESIDNHSVVHDRWRWIRAADWEHGKKGTEDEEDHSRPTDRNAEAAGIERPRLEFLLSPYHASEDWSSLQERPLIS